MSSLRAYLGATLTLGLILACFFAPAWLAGEIFSPAGMLAEGPPWHGAFVPGATNPLRSDDVYLTFPMVTTHLRMLLEGVLPTWDPYRLGGTPAFWGGVNLGLVLYPLAWVLGLPPVGDRLAVYAALRMLVGGLGMIVFLRALRLSPGATLLGGASFMLNGVFVVWLTSGIPTVWVWLPWMLAATERLIRKPGWLPTLGLAFATGAQFLGAYIAQSFVLMVAWGAFALGRLVQERAWSRMPHLALGLLGGAAVGALGYLPALMGLLGSGLAGRVSGSSSYPLYNAISFLVPNFFGNPAHGNWVAPAGNYCENITYLGVLPLFLALAAVVLMPRDRHVRLFAGLALITLLYLYGLPGLSQLALLPGFRQTLTSRWSAVFATCIPVLAAVGFDAVLARPRRALALWGGFGLGISLLVGAAMAVAWPELAARDRLPYQFQQLAYLGTNLVVATIVLVALVRGAMPASQARWVVLGLVVCDLMGIAAGFNPTTPRAQFYPRTPGLERAMADARGHRVLPFGSVLRGDTAGVYGLESLTGYDLAGDLRYRRYLAAMGDQSLRPEDALTPNGYLEVSAGRSESAVNLLRLQVDPRSPLLARLAVRDFLVAPDDHLLEAPAAAQLAADDVVGPLMRAPVRQGLVATRPFDRLELLLGTYARRNHGRLMVELVGPATASLRLPLAPMVDNRWARFQLPLLPAGRYTLTLRGEGDDPGNAIALYRSRGDTYPAGALDRGGDLAFRLAGPAPCSFPVVHEGADLQVVRNPAFHARAWWVGAARVVADEAALQELRADLVLPPVQVRLASGPELASTGATGSVRMLEQGPGRLVVEARSSAPGYVVLSERHDPHWEAMVDGSPAPLLRADVVVSAVHLSPGTHRVALRHRQPGWERAFQLSAGAMGLLLLGLVLAWRRRVAVPPEHLVT